MSIELQRKLFEKWFLGQGCRRLGRDGDGYLHIAAQAGWVAWQAAVEAQPKPAPVLLTDEGFAECGDITDGSDDDEFARAIEAAVLKKNGIGGG